MHPFNNGIYMPHMPYAVNNSGRRNGSPSDVFPYPSSDMYSNFIAQVNCTMTPRPISGIERIFLTSCKVCLK